MTSILLRLELPIKVALVSLPSPCWLLHLTNSRVQTMGLALVASVEITPPASIIPTLTLPEQKAPVAGMVALAMMTIPPLDALAAVMAALATMTILPPDALAEDLQVMTTPRAALAVALPDMTIPLEALAALAPGQVTMTTRAAT